MKCRCDKKCFRNMRTAHKAVERIMLEGGPQMRPYRCEYGAIHLTSKLKSRTIMKCDRMDCCEQN